MINIDSIKIVYMYYLGEVVCALHTVHELMACFSLAVPAVLSAE